MQEKGSLQGLAHRESLRKLDLVQTNEEGSKDISCKCSKDISQSPIPKFELKGWQQTYLQFGSITQQRVPRLGALYLH